MSRVLDNVFAALADPTRRGILAALAEGERPVSELAEPFDMSLPGFMKHLRTLEQAGLIRRAKHGRVVMCRVSPAPMREAAAWLAKYERFWTERLDALARFLEEEEQTEWPKQSHPSARRSRSGAASRRRPKKSGAR